MIYHDYSESRDEILNRARVNLPALFFAIVHHVGIKLHLTNEQDGELPDPDQEPLAKQAVKGKYDKALIGTSVNSLKF